MNKIFPYPVLGHVSDDYQDMNGYKCVFSRPSSDIVRARHYLQTDNLVGKLIMERKAKFFCTVVAHKVLYRISNLLDWEPQKTHDVIEINQDLNIPNTIDKTILMSHAGVVNINRYKCKWEQSLGIDEFLNVNNVDFVFKPLSIIASSGWFRFFHLAKLFVIVPEETLKKGSVKVELRIDDTNLRIYIYMHPELSAICQSKNRNNTTRSQVITLALTEALTELKYKYDNNPNPKDDDILNYATDLKLWLMTNGFGSWEEESFSASKVATSFRSIIIDQEDKQS